MTDDLCGQRYEYDDRTCDLPKDHDDVDHHRSGGFHWLHHEEFVAAAGDGDLTDDLWEVWDEPIDRLNGPKEPGFTSHTIHRIGLMNAPSDTPAGSAGRDEPDQSDRSIRSEWGEG